MTCSWGEDSWVKVGITGKEPQQRLSGVQVGCPFPVKVFGFFPGDLKMEAYLHNKLKIYQTDAKNEWFKIDPQEAWRLIWEDRSWQ